MKITPRPGNAQVPPGPDVNSAADARARAISKLTGPAATPAQTPVPNPSAVGVEELGAIMPSVPTPEVEEIDKPAEVEAKSEPAPQQTEDKKSSEDSLSNRFAMLARKEKAARIKIQQQEQALRAKEDALKAKEAEIAAKEQEYQSGYISKQRLKQSTLEALADAEISYDELTQQILQNQTPQDPRVVAQMKQQEAKISKLEKMLEEQTKTQKDQQTQQYQAALKQIKTNVTSLVNKDPAFEMVKATNSINDVVELIEKTYKEDGVLLTEEEAVQQVEDYLVEETERLARLDKIKKRLQPQVASKPEIKSAEQTQTVPPKPQMKTLTNATSSARPLSARERAVLAFKGELKS